MHPKFAAIAVDAVVAYSCTSILGAQKNCLIEYPQHMFWLRNKKISFSIRTLKSWAMQLSSSSDIIRKQFGPRCSLTKCQAWSGYKLFDTLVDLKKTKTNKNMHIYQAFNELLSCQPRVTVTPCFVYKVIRDLESIDHLCINPIRRIGLIHMWSIHLH